MFPLASPPPSARGSRPEPLSTAPLPWQYRPVAPWWPEFQLETADAHALANFVGSSGEPGLDVGSGSGQRLLICRQHGLDVDGQEHVPGLLALCQTRARTAGVGLRVYGEDLPSLQSPRRYRSISARDALGHTLSPERDRAALRRLFCLLEPGGTLILEHPLPPAGALWFLPERFRPAPPAPLLEPCEFARADGAELLRLSSQVFSYAARAAALSYTVHSQHAVQGEIRHRRGFSVFQRLYSKAELAAMLIDAGFERRLIQARSDRDRELQIWSAQRSARRPAPRALGPLGPIGQAGALGSRLGI